MKKTFIKFLYFLDQQTDVRNLEIVKNLELIYYNTKLE